MAQVLVFAPGSVGEAEKQALLAAGIVPIETADPASVRLLDPEGAHMAGGDLLFAALIGVNNSSTAQIGFAEALLTLAKRAREKPAPAPAMPARDGKGRFLKPGQQKTAPG